MAQRGLRCPGKETSLRVCVSAARSRMKRPRGDNPIPGRELDREYGSPRAALQTTARSAGGGKAARPSGRDQLERKDAPERMRRREARADPRVRPGEDGRPVIDSKTVRETRRMSSLARLLLCGLST